MKHKVSALIVLAAIAFTLSSCATGSGKQIAPEPNSADSSTSTLDGGVVLGDGVSIRELTEAPEVDPLDGGGGLIRQGEKSFVLEAGGSGSAACKSNFTAVERSGDEFILAHREGNGEKDMICTRDYRFTYFLVEAEDVIPDSATVTITNEYGDPRTLTFSSEAE